MGLASSPYIFSKISDFIVRCATRRGCSRVVNYLDDYCILGSTLEECTRDQGRLIEALRFMCFNISFKKLSSPAQSAKFLGIIINSQLMNLSLPLEKLEKLQERVGEIGGKNKVSKKELEKLAGYMAHASKVVAGT